MEKPRLYCGLCLAVYLSDELLYRPRCRDVLVNYNRIFVETLVPLYNGSNLRNVEMPSAVIQ